MPFIQIDVTRDGVTKAQKQELILGATQLLKDVLNKDFSLTHVIIREIDSDNWGLAGEQVTEIRKQINKQSNNA
ncbi:4-oxalocrotonate tautomerase [Lacibacter cauensis]|uniref:Tautomerase n=1 Tax=Lacibacter cauensis TaxID=510947 RepID=A0A562SH23_9BACT|nr:4-oxalocrotonate tautomerase family protein [Lacibacter cauensis]TWI80116.1 4-oxalocrotonate tautomerase [Lacibacter cauensis]TWI85811.1 4-oxalocrotonate tautomerase [Lacibacter cauensis]